MKYAVFWLALAAVPALAAVLSLNKRWIGWAFYGMLAGLYLYEATSISFVSYESYHGTANGVEISVLHLLALAVVLALAIRGKRQPLLPEGGIRLYVVYFVLCLPSLWNADSVVIGWLEVWKLMMLFLFWHAIYGYLAATGKAETVITALALFVIANGLKVVDQHYAFRSIQGVFPHRNGMAMAMNMLGPMFFAGYLQLGLRNRLGIACFGAFAFAGLCTMWSYSRGAIAVLPIGYSITTACCLLGARHSTGAIWRRLLPMVLVGLLGLVAIWPHLVERFQGASPASKNTRIILAHCAWEMMKDHPLAGVGINNWSLNMEPDHPYQETVEAKLDQVMSYSGLVETVYLLTGAECGIPALLAMLAWFGWNWVKCARATWRLRGTQWHFVAAGLTGGLTANYLQSTLEWVLRQRRTLFLLMFCFALAAWLGTLRRGKEKEA
ncbi:MAG: O-antigen ligase family protein [Kiritimatiellae bacterium]|nr:O-antigen ligase family protein [Kiritimatiellia bacterium]